MSYHDLETVGGIHIPYNWEYADATARTGATGLVAGDVGKFARQLDDDSLWMLTATTPTWVQVSQGGTVPAHALGGASHTSATLAELNAKISDANVDAAGSARPPSAHKASHESGGSDAIKLDDLAAPDDTTDLDASTSKHGLLKKLPGGTTDFLRADGSFAAPPGGGGQNVIAFSYEKELKSDSDTYEVVAYFPFRGTTELGTPTNIKAIAEVDSASFPGDIRIYDRTNSNQVCEKTGITATSPTITDLGTLSSLPTGEAVMEIQLKVPGGDKEDVLVWALEVQF